MTCPWRTGAVIASARLNVVRFCQPHPANRLGEHAVLIRVRHELCHTLAHQTVHRPGRDLADDQQHHQIGIARLLDQLRLVIDDVWGIRRHRDNGKCSADGRAKHSLRLVRLDRLPLTDPKLGIKIARQRRHLVEAVGKDIGLNRRRR